MRKERNLMDMETVKLSKYWRKIRFVDDSIDYEEVGHGEDYEDQIYTIPEAIEELWRCSSPTDSSDWPDIYELTAEHNFDGTIRTNHIHIDGTRSQLTEILKGLKC